MTRHYVWQRFAISFALALALAVSPPSSAQDQADENDAAESETAESDKPALRKMSPTALRAQALMALQQGDNETAIASADSMIAQKPDDSQIARAAGDIYLRAGKVDLSTRLFNQFVKARPQQLPELWQRGISLYFTGDYQEAAKQFEVHRTVNPHDVENAAWHFLCVAKAKSVAEARRLVLPAPGDPRIPMEEVLQMLSDGDTDNVVQRIEATPDGSPARESAKFYGEFYLGLYADALGQREKARTHMNRSAKDAPRNYMGDVARVYAQFLAKAPAE